MSEVADYQSLEAAWQSRRDPRLIVSDFGEALALDRYARRLDAQEARIRRKLEALRNLLEQRYDPG